MGFNADCALPPAPNVDSSLSPRVRVFLSFLAILFLAGVVFTATPSVARAQEEPAPAEGEKKAPPNLFMHIVVSAGVFFGPLLLVVSIALVTLIVLLAMDLRMSVAVPGLLRGRVHQPGQ